MCITLHEVLSHLEKPNSYVRILFIDYSSAFNTIIPQKLYDKLYYDLKFPIHLCNWILDFLLDRPQSVKIGVLTSSLRTINTGTPQGCPLSPKLYSIFTHDCKISDENNLLVKFADDATVSGFILDSNEVHYRSEVNSVVEYGDSNDLILNVPKTKEMVIDFRKNKTPIEPIIIKGMEVEQVDVFKLLGTFIENDLKWNCDMRISKARQRLYFLRKLKSFQVNKSILHNFYIYIIQSVMTSSITVWYDKITCAHKTKLNSIIRTCENIINTNLPSLEDIYIERMRDKTSKILKDKFHPARKYFEFLPSMKRMRTYKGNKRFTNSFFPQAVKLFNDTRDK